MTLAEKVRQVINPAPGIPRLNLPDYQWWSEVLHKRYPFTFAMQVPALHFAELDWKRISRTPEGDVADAARPLHGLCRRGAAG